VGEEGLGDLRGVKHLFNEELKGKIDRFVSVDGTGTPDITNTAVGSKRYRVTFKGPGGHSYGAFGIANPIHALGRAIDAIADIQVPATPKVTFNVGRIGGGTSVNSIAFEAWAEIDMRSADAGELKKVEAQILAAIDKALQDENARWKDKGKIAVEKTLVGDRPAGATPKDSAIVTAALSVATALGAGAELRASSTDANYPISLGIPAITIPGGGDGQHAHSLEETFDSKDSYKGTQWALLVAVALAQP
jgi:acetylornithine deacetylase/succinyl-diaminopimelate desuccinylase-like protein